jgi:predicted component of type VI protein secretion system
MNKRGTAIFFIFMMGIVFFLMGLALAKPTQEVVEESMLQLNCTTNYLVNTSIDNQSRAICTSMDMFVPLIVGTLFGLGGIMIGALAIR